MKTSGLVLVFYDFLSFSLYVLLLLLILLFYFIPSSEFNAYLNQIKVVLSTVKKYHIFSLVTNTIYIFSL